MKYKVSYFLPSLVLATFLLAGCAPQKSTSEFFAMDTVMQITAYASNGEQALAAAEKEINRLDALFSICNTNSDVYRLNQTGCAEVADETAAVIQEACTIYAETGGAFDITVYPVMDAWGFYSGAPDVPNDASLQNALKNCGCNHLILNGNTIRFAEKNMGIDLGGIAKGYASAAVAETLMQNGVESAVISLGGNIHVLGSKPDGTDWDVAIQDPEDAARYIGTVSVSDMAVVTAGSYQRYFEKDGIKYHHILDPKTGCPANTGLRSVTVVSRNDMEADALSTAFFVMGMEQAANYWREHGGFEILFVTDKNEVFITAGLSDSFSSSQEYEVIGIEN